MGTAPDPPSLMGHYRQRHSPGWGSGTSSTAPAAGARALRRSSASSPGHGGTHKQPRLPPKQQEPRVLRGQAALLQHTHTHTLKNTAILHLKTPRCPAVQADPCTTGWYVRGGERPKHQRGARRGQQLPLPHCTPPGGGLAGAEPRPGAELGVRDKAPPPGERSSPEALPLAQRLLSSRQELFHQRKIWTKITPRASVPEVVLAQPGYF